MDEASLHHILRKLDQRQDVLACHLLRGPATLSLLDEDHGFFEHDIQVDWGMSQDGLEVFIVFLNLIQGEHLLDAVAE